MRKYYLIFRVLIILVLFQSCVDQEKKELAQQLQSLLGKELKLPNYEIKHHKALKIATFVDGGCAACIDDLIKWKNWVTQYKQDIEFLFFVYAFDKQAMSYIDSSKVKMDHPLIFDPKKSFLIKNNLPPDKKMFQTFLLDKDNNVLLVGNPLFNNKLAELYKREIKSRTKQSGTIQ